MFGDLSEELIDLLAFFSGEVDDYSTSDYLDDLVEAALLEDAHVNPLDY